MDIVSLIAVRPRPAGKNICEWCVEQYDTSLEYQGLMMLAMHLFESQASIYSWPDKAAGLNGKHCNSEVWVRSTAPEVSPSGRFHCSVGSCSFSCAKEIAFRLHLRKKHWVEHEEDLDPVQSMDKVKQYFQEYFQYQISDEQVEQLKNNRKNNIARGKARRPTPKRKPRTKPDTSAPPPPSTTTTRSTRSTAATARSTTSSPTTGVRRPPSRSAASTPTSGAQRRLSEGSVSGRSKRKSEKREGE